MNNSDLEAGMRADEWPQAGSIRMTFETYKLLLRIRDLEDRVGTLEGPKEEKRGPGRPRKDAV